MESSHRQSNVKSQFQRRFASSTNNDNHSINQPIHISPKKNSSNERNNVDDLNNFRYLYPVSRTATSSLQYRMCIGLNVEENQSKHNRYVNRQLQIYRNYQKKQDDAYLRNEVTPHKIPGLGQRVRDRFVIESIAEARNQQWRNLVFEDHIEPAEASQRSGLRTIGRIRTDRFLSRSIGVVQSDIPKKLPKERIIIKKSRQQRRAPILYWGCGNF